MLRNVNLAPAQKSAQDKLPDMSKLAVMMRVGEFLSIALKTCGKIEIVESSSMKLNKVEMLQKVEFS